MPNLAELQQRQMMAQMLMNQSRQNSGGYQTPFSSIANVLSSVLAAKNMKSAGQDITAFEDQQKQQRQKDMSSALSAYRGDTPYQAETFGPEDHLPPGLMNMGTGNDRAAFAQSLLGSQDQGLQNLALKSMIPNQSSIKPYTVPIQTSKGWMLLDTRTKEITPLTLPETGQQPAQAPLLPIAADPVVQGNVSVAKAKGGKIGTESGVAESSLADLEAAMPRLNELVGELSELGKKATYTKTGQFYNTAMRELGLPVTEGAITRKEYITKVDNEILPLLRQTFGAQFTEREGNSLKATLGDPNASPEEKDAVLRSFIQTKSEQVKTLRRRTGKDPEAMMGAQTDGPQVGTIENGYEFLGGDPANQNSWKKVE